MVVETIFLVSRGHFWRNNFLSRKIFKISVVFRLWGKHFGFLAKIILLGCQNCFQVSRGYFWKSLFLKTNSLYCFSIFGLPAQIFWTFSEIFAIGSSKLHSTCPVDIFDWTVFSTKTFWVFPPSSGCEENILAFWRKSFKKFVKTAFFVYKKFRGKILFLKKTFTIFSSTDQKFCDFGKNVE